MVCRRILAITFAFAIGAAASPGRADDVTTSYGRRDQWQVIDQVGTRELGGARNPSRTRTPANARCLSCSTSPTPQSNSRK
jgi:hypothetical protein